MPKNDIEEQVKESIASWKRFSEEWKETRKGLLKGYKPLKIIKFRPDPDFVNNLKGVLQIPLLAWCISGAFWGLIFLNDNDVICFASRFTEILFYIICFFPWAIYLPTGVSYVFHKLFIIKEE
jgi:hypothetical protein